MIFVTDHAKKLRSTLAQDHKNQPIKKVRKILMMLISFERRSHFKEYFYHWAWPYQNQLKERRLEVATYFKSIGGRVSSLVLDEKLSYEKFPGLVRLVETCGFELVDES